ncbi:MAG: ABC transporter permease [Actinomycetota bacterium]|nr:ABC transporter permease [Actinomycetota bacterium]
MSTAADPPSGPPESRTGGAPGPFAPGAPPAEPTTDPSTGRPRRGAPRGARARTIAKQVGAALLTLLVISIVTFAATNVKAPEEVARNALGRETTEEQLQAYLEERGLDRPIYIRYVDWLGDFVRGDWGVSAVTNRPVRDDILPRFEKTLILSLVSLLVALPISVAIAVFMARRVNSAIDFTLLMGTVIVAALPEFVVGIGLLMIFSVTLGWLPVDSTGLSFATDFGSQAKAYVLPALTLVLAMVPYIVRIGRAAAREALAAPYVQAALLRGLSRRSITWDHAMRNAAVPMVNAVAINIVYLLSGVIVVENVFAFPGIGQLLVQAIGGGDTTMVQSIALVMGAMFILISLAADFLVVYFNPRLKAAH